MLTRPTILCATFLLATSATVALTTSCAQPLLNCTSAHGYFAAEYTLESGDPDSACGQLPGDVLGMQTYFQEGGQNGTPDYQNAKLAIRPESLGVLIDNAEARGGIAPEDSDEVFYQGNAIGFFTTGFPDDDTFCMVDEFEEDAAVSLPELPEVLDDPETEDEDESLPAEPATEVRYSWSNARFVVSADAQGTQFEADLEYSRDGCTASYHVVGVYPAVGCETNDDCNDDKNGINPDFSVRCNTDLGMCVLDDELPAYE
ncbi:hypothetical protein G6O69_00425 [Pseudenhygromyxa sp. WMMC2535]|uniref:hypothetical protein n=1 Tax=Pseudenhygromyxa sp. WMMC2535 TaxID=2712867 RepID=UPI0015552047|nr:hypothetical protein [Pseudenhygromyxa sp. WMMC2535]NVB36275.1 hypothetical protein [Pseudenhygromyxa sp. WMMC2535]